MGLRELFSECKGDFYELDGWQGVCVISNKINAEAEQCFSAKCVELGLQFRDGLGIGNARSKLGFGSALKSNHHGLWGRCLDFRRHEIRMDWPKISPF